ncbi:MAG TPA: NAD(P)H-binding protein [Polyangiales bacterium]
MFVILGGTGHIGSALAERLLGRGERVTIVSHDEGKRATWEARGADVALADVRDVPALRRALARGARAFLLNPPADPSSDTAKAELETAHAIAEAVRGAGLARTVVESTYGAQPGAALGDLGVLYQLERLLRGADSAVSVIRGAYYMSNWDASIPLARSEGRLLSLYPANFLLPMVAPRDIAQVADALLTADDARPGPTYVEGPERYTPADVAEALASVLRRSVEVETIPEPQWEPFLRQAGFSPAAARSMAAMTRATLENPELPAAPVRGATSLRRYLAGRLES